MDCMHLYSRLLNLYGLISVFSLQIKETERCWRNVFPSQYYGTGGGYTVFRFKQKKEKKKIKFIYVWKRIRTFLKAFAILCKSIKSLLLI